MKAKSIAETRLNPKQVAQLLHILSSIYQIPPPKVQILNDEKFKSILRQFYRGKNPERVLAMQFGDYIIFRGNPTVHAVLHEFRHYLVDKKGLTPLDPEADADAFANRILGVVSEDTTIATIPLTIGLFLASALIGREQPRASLAIGIFGLALSLALTLSKTL